MKKYQFSKVKNEKNQKTKDNSLKRSKMNKFILTIAIRNWVRKTQITAS